MRSPYAVAAVEFEDAAPAPIAGTDLTGVAGATFGAPELAELAPFGVERDVEAGEVLYRPGAETYDLFVILEGDAEIFRADRDGDVIVATHGQGRFLGELNMLTGQRVYLGARMTQRRVGCSRSRRTSSAGS